MPIARSLKALVAAMLLAVGLCAAAPAGAEPSLDAAKAAGLVGERPDGLVGTVKPAGPDIAALVERINSGRLRQYQDIAQKNGTPLAAVQAVAGQKLVAQAPPGSFVMTAAGSWQRK